MESPRLGHSAPSLIGREAERLRLDAFAARLHEGARALVLTGVPGIGKTALWREGVARCQRDGCLVLQTRPIADEMTLAMVGLVDLFEKVEPAVIDLRAKNDPFARGRLALGTLRRLVGQGPVVLAIDDLHWLDSISARALRFALRRLETEPVGVLGTIRDGSEAVDRLALEQNISAERRETLTVGPLDLESIRRVLAGTVRVISRPMLRRIHEVSGGNPLYAIELARALAAGEAVGAPPASHVLPESIERAIGSRLDTVPRKLMPLLETVAALGPAPVSLLEGILDGMDVAGLLTVGGQLGVLVVEDDLKVRFAHPMIGSAVYARMTPLNRRSIHTLIANHVTAPDVRARHLALSTVTPDPEIAALLEEAAERAEEAGAFDLAAEFVDHALRLTPLHDQEAGRRRALAKIVRLAAMGEVQKALGTANQLVATLPRGRSRAEILVQRSELDDDDRSTAEMFLLQALDDAGDDLLLRGRVLAVLGWTRAFKYGDLPGGIECLREALAIAEQKSDAGLQIDASTRLAHVETLAGRPRPDLMHQALALEGQISNPYLWAGPRAMLAKQLFWAADLAASRVLSEETYTEAQSAERELQRPYRLHDLALIHCATGDFGTAADLVERAMEAAQDAENAWSVGVLLYPLALVEAWRGNAAAARTAARGLLERAERGVERPGMVRAKCVLGLLALSEGDAAAAAVQLSDAAQILETMGAAHPVAFPVLPDAVEALAASGDLDSARSLLDRLERQADALDNPWAWAASARSRGMLLLAEGDPDGAALVLMGAAARFDQLGYGPDAARAVLGHGRALLRCGRRSMAADSLYAARNRFAAMGAVLWELRAAGELDRVAPGRASGRLTPTEVRIAALVAQGKRNREIAQIMFVSVATVEAHLTRTYRKLGIRSRSELTRLISDGSIATSARPVVEDAGGLIV